MEAVTISGTLEHLNVRQLAVLTFQATKTAVVQILPLNRQGNVGIFEAMSELFRTIYLDQWLDDCTKFGKRMQIRLILRH